MLAIRMQRVGRKGHPEYRVVVQDSALSPTSGRVVARLGHFNPHTKSTTLDKEKTAHYLGNGAQPSDRVVKLLVAEKIKLPDWVAVPRSDREGKLRNPEKLRKNQPKEEVQESKPAVEADSPAPATTSEEVQSEAADETADESKEEAAAEEPEEKSAE